MNELEAKVDEVKERCRQVQENTQQMVQRFETELKMRRMQREYEEKKREEELEKKREEEQRSEMEDEMNRSLADGESLIYVDAFESVIIPRD